jgi:hypothetical protein
MFRNRSSLLPILTGVLFCISLLVGPRTAAVTPNSLSLNGSTDYMSVANSTSLNITGPITVEAWVKTYSTAQQGIVERYGSGTNGGYALRLTGGYLQFFTLVNGGTYDYIQSTVTVSTGAWHHVAGLFDGSQLRVYIDGTQRGSKSSTFAPGTGTNTIRIGARSASLMPAPRLHSILNSRATSLGCRHLCLKMAPRVCPLTASSRFASRNLFAWTL